MSDFSLNTQWAVMGRMPGRRETSSQVLFLNID
jgi:hypothetical protein